MASFLLKVRLTEASDIRMRRKFFFLAFKAEYERRKLLENLKFESILDSILSRKTFSGKKCNWYGKKREREKTGESRKRERESFQEAHSNAIE